MVEADFRNVGNPRIFYWCSKSALVTDVLESGSEGVPPRPDNKQCLKRQSEPQSPNREFPTWFGGGKMIDVGGVNSD